MNNFVRFSFTDVLISQKHFDLDELKEVLNAMLYCSDRKSTIVSEWIVFFGRRHGLNEITTTIHLFSDGAIV